MRWVLSVVKKNYSDILTFLKPLLRIFVHFDSRKFFSFLHQVSMVLRGANDYMLDEMERALHDALCIVKRTLESNTVSLAETLLWSCLLTSPFDFR